MTLKKLLDRLDADPDTGEVDGEALAAYAEYTTAAAEKLEGTACYCRELKAEAFRRIKTTIDPDKVALKKALKDGETIPGAALEERQSVVIS